MSGPQPILLLEQDDEIINDVSFSLKLVNVPIVSVKSVTDARHNLLEVRPCLIIARLGSNGYRDEVIELLTECAAHPKLSNIPVMVLVAQQEMEDNALPAELVRIEWTLPIAFPAFTQKIQDILSKVIVDRQKQVRNQLVRSEPFKPKTTVIAEPTRLELKTARPADSAAVLSREATVYGIHLEVLRELEKDKTFFSANSNDVAAIILETTKKVCQNWGKG